MRGLMAGEESPSLTEAEVAAAISRDLMGAPGSVVAAALRATLDLGGVASITPEMVLMLAHQRLSELDKSIQQGLDTIQQATAASEELLFRQEVLQALRTAAAERGNSADTKLTINPESYISVGGASMKVSDALQQAGITDLGAEVSIGALDSRLEQVKTESRRLGSRNEMEMMELQQKMGQRTQTIQLCSNVSKTLLDAASSVIGNMRG
ncbi:MAG: hypothetical protein H6721_32170 [Sandaracinus sp.]|nr:hypothetical protein [Sandaracinus sp.]MCB9633776.1 hypothetical protein [Sandaracinus sp.]MCB9636791.1 hypothetical protein [Sandaracinus sp.]